METQTNKRITVELELSTSTWYSSTSDVYARPSRPTVPVMCDTVLYYCGLRGRHHRIKVTVTNYRPHRSSLQLRFTPLRSDFLVQIRTGILPPRGFDLFPAAHRGLQGEFQIQRKRRKHSEPLWILIEKA